MTNHDQPAFRVPFFERDHGQGGLRIEGIAGQTPDTLGGMRDNTAVPNDTGCQALSMRADTTRTRPHDARDCHDARLP